MGQAWRSGTSLLLMFRWLEIGHMATPKTSGEVEKYDLTLYPGRRGNEELLLP